MTRQWTEQQVEQLVSALCDGQTYREIAAATGRSRSAVGAFIMRNPEVQSAAEERRRRDTPRPRLPRGMLFNQSPTGPVISKGTLLPIDPAHGRLVSPDKPNGAPKPPHPAPKPKPAPTPPPRPAPPPPEPVLREPVSLGLTLAGLTAIQCRWPGPYDPKVVGGFRFCGHPVHAAGASYCRYHDRLAVPSAPRQPGAVPRERLVR